MAQELLKDLIYGEQLVTPGCKVEFAVGLTYSLNLEAMLTVPLAFGDLGELDSDVKLSPAYLLEGIRRSSDKIVLFCNKGGIHVPQETRTIYSLMEGSIFEVQNEKDILSNFHPKIWLVHEIDKDGLDWLKLSVMSRNLDFSTYLDICCSLRGRINKRRSSKGMEKHKPLKDMLFWLSDYANAKAEKVRQIAGLLDYVDHFEVDSPFQKEDEARNEDEGYGFFPFVYGKEEFAEYGSYLNKYMPGDRILVISPFIDVSTLSWLTSRVRKDWGYESKNTILITRKEYVTKEVFDLFEQVWIPNDTMIDNTTANVDLHAKMYLTQRLTGQDLGYTLYLGSTNATKNGFNKNAEFLLRLHYKRTTTDRIKELLEEMVSEHRFVVMDAPNPEASNDRPRNEKELALKRAVSCLNKATIKESDVMGLYDIKLSAYSRSKFDEDITIRPLQCRNLWKPIGQQVDFNELVPSLLSEFYVLRKPCDDGTFIEMVAKVKTSGMPANRDEAIYQSIITKKEELLDYVAFMLSDRPAEFFYEQQIMEMQKGAAGSVQQTSTMPLYEQLLRTASNNPEQINEVIKFIKKMNKDIVPVELMNMLQMFQNVSKQISAL